MINMGRFAEGADENRRSLAVAREIGFLAGEVAALMSLGYAALHAGDHDNAVQLARLAAQICTVSIVTQLWRLERWVGDQDPPDLEQQWGSKHGFAVRGRRSCAELAALDHLRRDGWHGVWVNPFGRELRAEWFRPHRSGRLLRQERPSGWWRSSNAW